MKKPFRIALFLVLFFQYSWSIGASKDPFSEAENNLLQLRQLQTQFIVGLDTEQNRYAQAVYAQDMVDLLKTNPDLLFNNEIMTKWYKLDISKTSDFVEIAKEYLGLHLLVRPDMGQLFRHLAKDGFIEFLQKAFPQKSSLGAQSMALEWAHEWKKRFMANLSHEKSEIRDIALRYIFASVGRPFEIAKMTENILRELPPKDQLRFARDINSNAHSKARSLVAPVLLENISFKVFVRTAPQLFANILVYGSWDKNASIKVAKWLTRTPTIADSNISIVNVGNISQETRPLIANASNYTLVEQLFLLYGNYRTQLYSHFVIESNGERGLRLFDLAIEYGIKGYFSMAQALAQEFVSQDPRWVKWMNSLPDEVRQKILGRIVRFEALYKGTTEADYRLQKAVVNDALRAIQSEHPTPMAEFIKNARVNDKLVERMVDSWGVRFLQFGKVSITRTFVENIFFHHRVKHSSRIQWLEVILEKEISDHRTLKHLVEGFGKDRAIFVELLQLNGSEKAQKEIYRMTLTDVLIDHRTRSPFPFCLRVFQ